MATFLDIANAVAGVITGLAQPGPIIVRKESALQPRDPIAQEVNPTPMTLVWLKLDGGIAWATTGDGGVTSYGTVGRRVVIGIDRFRIVRGDITGITVSQALLLNEFEAIKKALNKPKLAAAGTVWNTLLGTSPLWENHAFAEGGEMSHCELTFMSGESRN